MKNQNRTHGLWAHTAGKPPVFETAKGEISTDVAVIGGGYSGLSAALHLAQDNTRVTLLEGRDIGYGGAGRNVGLVNAGLWLMPSDVIAELGKETGEALISVLGKSPDLVFDLINTHNIPCEAVRTGTLHCAHSGAGFKALEQREAQWLERGAPVKLLNRKEAAPMIGSHSFYGALLDKRAGTVQPLAYAFGLARAARTAGADIFTHSPVLSYERISSGWQLTTPGATIKAKAVILAVQGYAEQGFDNLQQNLIPFNFFQFATQPLPESVLNTILPGRQGAWDTALILSSYRLDAAGRLIVGSVGQAEQMAFGLHKKWVQRSIARAFPQIREFTLEHAWHGRIAMTPNHIPRCHILGDNFISVTSYNGRGIGPGSVFGKLMAQYIQTGSAQGIPLPVTPPETIFMRGARGLFYEAGARVYHMAQKRCALF